MKTPQDLVAAAKAHTQEVPVAEAEAAIRDADALIDVREESEFAAGHIPGAIHASRGMLEFKLAGSPACFDVIALQARMCAFKFGEIALGNSWQSVVNASSVSP